MAGLRPSFEDGAGSCSDPWDWSVEDVVNAFCNPESQLRRAHSSGSFPDDALLAGKIRDLDVTGLALLKKVDGNCLKNDFGIKSMGHLAILEELIEVLQHESAKYQDRETRRRSSLAPSSNTGWASRMATPYSNSPFQGRPPSGGFLPLQSPRAIGNGFNSPLRSNTTMDQEFNDINSSVGIGDYYSLSKNEWPPKGWTESQEWEGKGRSDLDPKCIALNGLTTLSPRTLSAEQFRAVAGDLDPGTIWEQSPASGRENDTKVEDATLLDFSLNIPTPTLQVEDAWGAAIVTEDSVRKRKRIAPTNIKPLGKLAEASEASSNRSSSYTAYKNRNGLSMTPRGNDVMDEPLSGESKPGQTEHSLRQSLSPHRSQIDDSGVSQTHLPGKVHLDDKGRKRVVPILQSAGDNKPAGPLSIPVDIQSATPHSPHTPTVQLAPNCAISTLPTSYGRKATRHSDQAYLGHDSFGVDQIFYASTTLGGALSDTGLSSPQTFCLDGRDNLSCGQRLYVHNRMKHFLQRKPFIVTSNGRPVLGLIPYPSRIARKHHPLSMTIISNEPDSGLRALRSNRAIWIDDGSSTPKSSLNVFTETEEVDMAHPSFALDVISDDRKTLEKWRQFNGKDEVLPAYGDSGSENEYDLKTWKEMEEESGTLPRALGRSRKPVLSNDEVEAIISKAVTSISEEWKIKEQPKLQRKAWRIWTKAKRNLSRQYDIRQVEESMPKLESRIGQLRHEIAAEAWTDKEKVFRQCKILQPSLFDLEELRWRRGILQLPKAPEKFSCEIKKQNPKKVLTRVLPPAMEDEIDISSDGEVSEASQDSLDDFIVHDDEAAILDPDLIASHNDLALANVDDEKAEGSASEALFVSDGPNDQTTKQEPVLTFAHQSVAAEARLIHSGIIDLTQASSDIDPTEDYQGPETKSGIITPPVNSGNENDLWERPPKRSTSKPETQKPKVQTTYIDLDTTSDQSDMATTLQGKSEQPPFEDVVAIGKMDSQKLVEAQDRKRLLIWIIDKTKANLRSKAFRLLLLHKEKEQQMQNNVLLGLKAYLYNKNSIGELDEDSSTGSMQVALWFLCFTVPIVCDTSGLWISHIQSTIKVLAESFGGFFRFVLQCMTPYKVSVVTPQSVIPEKQREATPSSRSSMQPQKLKKERIVRDVTSLGGANPPHRKRVYQVQVSQETLDKREAAQNRLKRDEARRQQQLALPGVLREDGRIAKAVILNPGKLDTQEFIQLDSRFGNGRWLRPHQVEGLQFLWREITVDQDDLQGCMLAHTMGLGKTVQVIALLVALAGASQSLSENIRSQVPLPLQEPQTLILCPPSLLENWYDELLIWLPRETPEIIGPLRKVNAVMHLRDRVTEVQEEQREQTEIRPLEERTHHLIKQALLERTKLVIADEAHEFKNHETRLHKCVNLIRTTSRIALTGSPLSNNLVEYWAIIDWISPGFLGTSTEFKATYVEPIGEGLYQDSTIAEYRAALKRLKALQMDMEPKVHRADFAVLHDQLQGKMEFVIRLHLTEVQLSLYRIFVDIALSSVNSAEPQPVVLWSWLRLLQLLCHHPRLYYEQLLSLKAEMEGEKVPAEHKSKDNSKSTASASGDQYISDNDEATIHSVPESQPIVGRILEETESYLAESSINIKDISLSHKMAALMYICHLSPKVGNKVLIISYRLPTLDYVAKQLKVLGEKFVRIDGKVPPQQRQALTKAFNEGTINICLISAKAGGVGLNLFGANRVVILDQWFNPMVEQQAIGRAYRIGQIRKVFVYRLLMAGTFEEVLQNQSLYKEQLAHRVVDKKHPIRSATKGARHYFFEPREEEGNALDEFVGKDPSVLNHLLELKKDNPIASITPTESFHIEDKDNLTPEEKMEAEQIFRDEQLRRRDPLKYQEMILRRQHPSTSSQQLQKPQASSSSNVLPLIPMQPSRSTPTQLATSSSNQGSNVPPERNPFEIGHSTSVSDLSTLLQEDLNAHSNPSAPTGRGVYHPNFDETSKINVPKVSKKLQRPEAPVTDIRNNKKSTPSKRNSFLNQYLTDTISASLPRTEGPSYNFQGITGKKRPSDNQSPGTRAAKLPKVPARTISPEFKGDGELERKLQEFLHKEAEKDKS